MRTQEYQTLKRGKFRGSLIFAFLLGTCLGTSLGFWLYAWLTP